MIENNHLPEGFSILKESKTKLTYYKGETVFKQDAFAPYVIYVIEGLVKVYLRTGQTKMINLSLATKGDFLALSAIFGNSHYTTSAVALTDTMTCMIDKESLAQLLRSNSDLAIQLSAQNHRFENRFINLIRSLSYNQMRGKLASALLYLADEKFIRFDVFSLLSRQELADFSGISLESAVKFLKEFAQEGIIQVEGRLISVQDQERLMDLSLHG